MENKRLIIKFRKGQPPVGSFVIAGGMEVAVFTKPFIVHRWIMRALFGWRWVAAKPEAAR